jgi:hypothetical protein
MNRNVLNIFHPGLRARQALLVAAAVLLAVAPAGGDDAKPGDDAEKKRFREVYQLKEGEAVKFIPAPFMPGRGDYLNRSASDTLRLRGQLTCAWDDTKQGEDRLMRRSFSSGNGTITSAFADCGQLTSTEYELEGSDVDKQKPLDGDWIFRMSASREERMKAVEKIVAERAKVPVRAQKVKADREVLVARGKFQHKKLRGTLNDDAVHLYTNELDRQEGAGGGGGKLRDFLVRVGDYTRYRVIDETESSDEKVVWRNHNSAGIHNRNPDWLTQLLKNVQDQTGLEFKFEQRPVELWVIRVGKAAEEKDPPKEGL